MIQKILSNNTQQRARLRHNRSSLTDHLYHMNRINSPIGNNYTDNVNEATEHALIHCIKHQSIRDKYINAIHSIIRSQQSNTSCYRVIHRILHTTNN